MQCKIKKGDKRFAVVFFLLFCACIVLLCFTVVKAKDILYGTKYSQQEKNTIIIDAGHGGPDGGAVSGNIIEKDINLAISLKLQSICKASGFNVVMIREDDSSIYSPGSDTLRQKKVTDIHNRLKLSDDNPTAPFISIHQNKFSQPQYSGAQTFYSKNNSDSKVLADLIQKSVKKMIQPQNERAIKPAGKNLYILYHAKAPAVMVECGFISNAQEAKKLQNDNYQGQMAFSIFCGILNYYSEKSFGG